MVALVGFSGFLVSMCYVFSMILIFNPLYSFLFHASFVQDVIPTNYIKCVLSRDPSYIKCVLSSSSWVVLLIFIHGSMPPVV